MTSTLIAGPGEEPVSLADAKAWCRVDVTDDDALLAALISAARLQVESATGRALVTQSWRLTLPHAPMLVVLPVAPVQSLTSAPDGAALQGDAVLLAAPMDDLTIDYVAGYGDASAVPGDLKQAILMLVAYWYEHRDSASGTTPAGFDRLVAPYVRVRLSESPPPIGTLTDRVELKTRVTTTEDEGGEVALFTPLATVWARVRMLTARQTAEGEARGSTLTHSVVIRYRSDFGPGDRVTYRGRDLEVTSASDLNGGKAYLSCQCSERAVTG